MSDATTSIESRVTLTPADGVKAHPAVRPWSPAIQVQQAGPGVITWRVHEDSTAVSHNTRTGTAYAAGRATYPADDGSAVTAADAAAWLAADAALGQVRHLLRDRDRGEARKLAEGGIGAAEIARRLSITEAQAGNWTGAGR